MDPFINEPALVSVSQISRQVASGVLLLTSDGEYMNLCPDISYPLPSLVNCSIALYLYTWSARGGPLAAAV